MRGQRWFGPPGGGSTATVLAWYDASQITGQADGSALASWPDESGNGRTMTAGGTGTITYYSSTAGKTVNGKPAVWFPGSAAGAQGAYMATATAISGLTTGVAMFVVAQIATAPVSQSGQCPFYNGIGGTNGYGPALMTYTSNDKGWLAGGVAWQATADAYDTNLHLLSLFLDSAGAAHEWIDGVETTVPSASPVAPTGYSLLGTHDEAGGVGVVFLDGPLCEARFYYHPSDGTADIASINSALMTKWGI